MTLFVSRTLSQGRATGFASMSGALFGTLLAGAILTETIFSWPGIGKWLVEAIHRRDYPAVQGGILMSATIIILVNLLVDLLYGVVNPRIRHHA